MDDFVNALIHEEMTLEAGEYKDRSSLTVVMNTQTVSKYVYIHLPVECVHLELLGLIELNSSADTSDDPEAMPKDAIIKYKDHPWARIKSDVLNWAPGKHVYKLSFGVPHQLNPNKIDYYISYVSQEDNPEKPYVYMRR